MLVMEIMSKGEKGRSEMEQGERGGWGGLLLVHLARVLGLFSFFFFFGSRYPVLVWWVVRV